jgi:hypothetical protein
MIDPASMGDWMQASIIVSALGGIAAACKWALLQEEPAAGSGVILGRVPVAARPTPVPSEQTRRLPVGGNLG